MNKYNEIEAKTAENLLKEGYKWIAMDESGGLFAYTDKPIKLDTFWCSAGNSNCVCYYVPIFQSIRSDDKEPVSLENIVHPQILDDVERRYLSAVIRPFRDNVLTITKLYTLDCSEEWLFFICKKGSFDLLKFKAGIMYKGMENGRTYTLEELGL